MNIPVIQSGKVLMKIDGDRLVQEIFVRVIPCCPLPKNSFGNIWVPQNFAVILRRNFDLV